MKDEWAKEHMPAQDAPRETTTEFFKGVIDLVKASGFWPNQSKLVICEPVKPYWPPEMIISHPGFKFLSKLEVDPCNQLYIACYLCGFIDGKVDHELLIGTIISTCRNRDVCLAMGSLTGALLYYGEVYREANLNRYVPYKTAELHPQQKRRMKMVNRYCKCCYHLAGRPDAAANFYNDHFIPTHWAMHYSKLSECWGVSLYGRCNDCGGDLEELIPIPKGLTGDALFQAIYDTMQTAHPYDRKTDADYYGQCKARSEFYKWRDQRSQFRRSKEFLDLFHDWDREAARLWLEKNYPPEKPTEVFRDTGGSLFSTVIRIAQASGDFVKAEAILDYYLPCEHEEGRKEGVQLTAYEFDFVPILNYGCEGIYIDCYLQGKFDESGRSTLHVGTLKTLKRDLEAEKIMGELCGILHHYENEYVNNNLRRYTPDKQLEAEYKRQFGQKEAEGGGEHE